MSALDRWLAPFTPGATGDKGDTPLKAAGIKALRVAPGVSPTRATVGDTGDTGDATREPGARQGRATRKATESAGSGEVSPVSPRGATGPGDAQRHGIRGFQPAVAPVAPVARSVVSPYLVELAFYDAHKHEVPGPCPQCGDEVFHRAGPSSPWRCRSCVPAMGRVEWLVIGQGPVRRAVERERASAQRGAVLRRGRSPVGAGHR